MKDRFISAGFILVLICGILPAATLAQEKERHAIRTGVDLLIGNNIHTFRPHISLGFEITPRFSAGLGTGYVPYGDPVNLVPVFLDLVYLVDDKRATPYLQLRTGYSISLLQNHDFEPDRHRGGFYLNPGVGIQIRPEEAQGFYLSAGFNLDQSVLERDLSGNRVMKDSMTWRRVSIGIGCIIP